MILSWTLECSSSTRPSPETASKYGRKALNNFSLAHAVQASRLGRRKTTDVLARRYLKVKSGFIQIGFRTAFAVGKTYLFVAGSRFQFGLVLVCSIKLLVTIIHDNCCSSGYIHRRRTTGRHRN
jgi:hypothetical protein